ncbi:UDP-N-acetylglucosamine 1-carboxyvinyltransferase [Lentilactobacillus hilgardii]|uniref:UDP-N-acetylglucosamine 1-carboxyvinyltransferase n=1 Tax=Lentilactobacillus hilgardii (strain ATCC 8290 / DSM 20176 / CCUG 30140 / JCM 1155 / KCTC 3500 / NBRC 15886 / NCIMB 8040 / NRRL B-1843 / 9) TaxID=1423757 RepID=C0XL82_LENH9|nr:UDP-N-acetylglucosamine 1-carboxyvinyltransferase [Lentilactobacillus hilgardii]EEI18956.1 UDP-N-acetylglucosamine 1-carboxyvinyltransferase [Lentilactobacillus buchneri ATCC 11577]EEI23827.1 UDP-N-acetylglucosamine 1-carboxyvinyltransferase [Lentilactobacillus hilgardii DSM 20176 = ATCC 8290]KRK59163.1 UDP-N-acetylglucosamine 1-carboxyvinyltransferase [Lentilactobacillus hilgardii DSM 20176 = ATCC 8290]MCT3395416.1 UDP-N-acetylglucosamine 1-carboxyvinyltransferase [Lentilactobacillus hilgar
MEKIIVHGGNPLKGRVHIDGAKNAVLPIQAATILASEGHTSISNVPLLSDVYTMNNVLRFLNVKVDFDELHNEITFDASSEISSEAPFEYVSKMRASIVVMGPLLARLGRAKVALPGGCAIGSRPIDLHLKGFEALGATIEQHDGYVEATAPNGLVGTDIYLDFPSVGATQNIMMAATLATGKTIIQNAAREPEIVDLANVLNKMGAKVVGAGTEQIRIQGVSELHGTDHSVVQDRIEAGTFMIAAAVTKGDVLIEDAIAEHNKPLILKMREMGVSVTESDAGIRVIGPDHLKPVDVKTLPHPGFPTDMQPQMTILQLAADGNSSMTETVFENRFMHMEELRRMNAKYTISGRTVIMNGPTDFNGAEVAATDLRAAAALVIAGLVAKGYTQVSNLQYLDRGYYDFHKKLASLGAEIKRVNVEDDSIIVNQSSSVKHLNK